MLGSVRSLDGLGRAIETMRAALNALAIAAPDRLRLHADPAWAECYGKPADHYRIPQGEAARRACAEGVGRDGHALLAAVATPDAPAWLREVPAVVLLRRIWIQNFCLAPVETGEGCEPDGLGEGAMVVRWRTTADERPSAFIPTSLPMVGSPSDPGVHYAKKKSSTTWIGDKVHLTETCDDERPHLITHVETTLAPVVDRDALQSIHESLAGKDSLPGKQLVDAGYIDAGQLVASTRDHGVELIGPTPKDHRWQAETDGAFTIQDFALDWDGQLATCPAGHTSQSWTAGHNRGRTVTRIYFSTTACKTCTLKPRCTRAPRRLLTPRRREEHTASEAARARETKTEFADEHRRRAGIEGTLSQGVRTMHLRRSRYIVSAKTHFRHVLTAAAMNLGRLGAWLAGTPRERSRQSAFSRLMVSPAAA